MKLKSIMLAAMLAAGSLTTSAYADVTKNVVLENNSGDPNFWTAGFSNVPVNGPSGSFTDTFIFTPELSVGSWGSGALVNFSLFGLGDLSSISASLNGYTFADAGNGWYSLDPVYLTPGPLTLTISGIVTSGGGSYGGNLNVLAVPEPETYAMMLGGLGMLGFMARRRKQQG